MITIAGAAFRISCGGFTGTYVKKGVAVIESADDKGMDKSFPI